MQLDMNTWRKPFAGRSPAVIMPIPPSKHYIYKHSLRSLFGLTSAMIRALGKPDIDSCADSLPGDGLYAVERVEEWADTNAEWIVSESVITAIGPESTRVPETLEWAHTVRIEMLEM